LEGLSEDVKRVIAERGLAPQPYTLRLTYDYWTADHVLKVRAVLARRACGAARRSH
jgi:hypothetical protein